MAFPPAGWLMVLIAVFDSGLGSLSVIRPIQRELKCDILYFADSRNFPYGTKPIRQLRNIARDTISALQDLYGPNMIIVGSNTLSLTLQPQRGDVLTVLPPLKEAGRVTRTRSVAILATESIANSRILDEYINRCKIRGVKVTRINASNLVELVESGRFLSDPPLCRDVIKETLGPAFLQNSVDAATLSSTHLPFLSEFFKELFPGVAFLDPGESIAKKLKQKYGCSEDDAGSLRILTSGDIGEFQKKLGGLGVRGEISSLTIR